MEGRERVIGDPRSRRRHGADERRLPGVRQAEQSDIGNQLQLEAKLPPLARVPGGRLARRAISAALEPLVSKSALTAAGNQHTSSRLREIAQLLLGVHVVD